MWFFMTKLPTPETIAATLTVPERMLLFCIASDTDWTAAGVASATTQHIVRGGLGVTRPAHRWPTLARLETPRSAGGNLRE
jgi:hypothetical protein